MTRPNANGAGHAPARVARPAGAPATFALAMLMLGGAACDQETPVPRLYTVTPQRLHSDRPQRLRLTGSELVPRYDVDLSSGSRHADPGAFSGFVGSGAAAAVLRDFAFLGPGTVEATLDPGLPAGIEDVVVIDPRGARAVLAGGFISLGLDTAAPALSIISPAGSAELAPGTPVAARAVVDDDGAITSVAWQASGSRGPVQRGNCVPPEAGDPGAGHLICDFAFTVPAQLTAGDEYLLLLTATDNAPLANRATVSRSFLLQAPPLFASVAPMMGSAAGGTDVVIRGHGFRPGTQVRFGDAALDPDGGILLDEGTIVGKSPPNPAGTTVVRVLTPLGDAREDGVFEYLEPPALIAIEPARAPSIGGIPITIHGHHFTAATRIYLGASLATALALGPALHVDPDAISGLVPAGLGVATVFAVDPSAGWAQLPAAFTWETAP